MKTQYGEINVQIDKHVALLTFERPPSNHISVEMVRDMADALNDIDADKDIRASVMASDGKPFCAGADLVNQGGIGANGMAGVNPLYVEAARMFEAKKPMVAAVQGAAVGAGLGLSLVADFRVVAPEARFVSNFVKLGFHPGFATTLTLPRVIGEQKAALMHLTGRRITGEQAFEWGLADVLVPLDELRAAALKLAAEIAENAPLAVQATRKTIRDGLAEAVRNRTDHELAEQTWLRETKDFAEGVRAVNERRPGNFVGA